MFDKSITLEYINSLSKGNMGEHLDIKFVEITNTYLIASMPVDYRTKQPFGMLHGGASVVLAETVGSIAGNLLVNHLNKICVGLEINANHLRPVTKGLVFAKAEAIHIGGKTHVWDIKITNEDEKLVCVSRLTLAVIPKS